MRTQLLVVATHLKSLKDLSFSTASLAISEATIQIALLTDTGGWSEPCTKSSFTCTQWYVGGRGGGDVI